MSNGRLPRWKKKQMAAAAAKAPGAKYAYAYARYSSDSQNDASIEQQMHSIDQWAVANDYVIVGRYSDHGMTGTDDRRPDLQRMMADVRSRKDPSVTAVIVYKLDRFFS